jgi:hypothetical protein
MHQWQSATMKFESNIDLNQPVITMGPYTLLTVDKGYEAVTQSESYHALNRTFAPCMAQAN